MVQMTKKRHLQKNEVKKVYAFLLVNVRNKNLNEINFFFIEKFAAVIARLLKEQKALSLELRKWKTIALGQKVDIDIVNVKFPLTEDDDQEGNF